MMSLFSFLTSKPFSSVREMFSFIIKIIISIIAGTSFGLTSAASLTIEDGVVVKFGQNAKVVVHDDIHSKAGTVFTSINDGFVLGNAASFLPDPMAGDWCGLTINRKAKPEQVIIDGLLLKFAGGNNCSALSLKNLPYLLERLTIQDSVVGLRIDGQESGTNPGEADLTEMNLLNNQIGMEILNNAAPSISLSNIVGNADYGVLNHTPDTPVSALGNWWGHNTGPKNPNNSNGRGDRVSEGVDYGDFSTNRYLTGCSIAPEDGNYITQTREIDLTLNCPLANQVRLSETNTFTGSYTPLISPKSFTLSEGIGEKQVYAQYRASSDGATVIVGLVQSMIYDPNDFMMIITSPQENSTITSNVLVSVTAIDNQNGIKQVEFFIDDVSIGIASIQPYTVGWNISEISDGTHTIKAIATNQINQTIERSINVLVKKTVEDNDGPSIALSFAGQLLDDGATITVPGNLIADISDISGIRKLKLSLDGAIVSESELTGTPTSTSYSSFISFEGIANGTHILSVTAEDALGNIRAIAVNFTLTLSAPDIPVITSPINGATVSLPNVTISGRADAGSQIQLYLNGTVSGSLISVDNNGNFTSSITLPNEGNYNIQVDARNSRGVSAKSLSVTIVYTASGPSVSFISPVANIVLTDSVEISLLVTEPSGSVVNNIVITLDGQLLATLTDGDTHYFWDITDVPDGAHVLKAIATSANGKTGEAIRNVTVQKPKPIILTPYTGEIQSVLPSVSYGWDPVIITGRAKDRETNASLPLTTLRMILKLGSFQRRINVVTDEAGHFNFRFIPQASDAGTYEIAALHPDETSFVAQSQFTINRISTNYTSYSLNAARGIEYTIPLYVTASAGTGSRGVRWVARPEDQPSGSLPSGIVIDGGSGVDLPAGSRAPVQIRFKGTTQQETGTIIFTLLASNSGVAERGKLVLNWRLSDPQPALYPSPTYIEIGTQQNTPVSGVVSLQNKGLAAAHNVRVQLQTHSGGLDLPDWISLSSSEELGTLDVGQSQKLQINAVPGSGVSDGFYRFQIMVTSDNAQGGTIPILVAVSQAGQGNVRFEISDLYTNTLDESGQPILGVRGASIFVQNEAVTTIQKTAISNVEGVAEIKDLPPGAYRYRASASNRISTSGRFRIMPGITTTQAVFLDYQVINVEFNVVETTIQDHYDIVIEATYQTQVPAPVVLLQPTAINLPDMQVGEELTGELTLSNYGLVRADNVVFTPPKSDEYFDYEFLAEVPQQLEAKARITIPYRITMKKLLPGTEIEDKRSALKARLNKKIAQPQTKAGVCHSYRSSARVSCEYECANGQWSQSCGSGSGFHRNTGSCGSSGSSGGGGGGSGGGWGGSGGGGGYTPGPVPMTPKCDPDCEKGSCC
ncbi:MAG: hypothetical protein LBS40_05600 [Burkholderiales bacterium]|jgi:uncharacterized membrane protein YgcG|nr:hypothetical protein [Burkholderiales bacterium]